MSLPRGMILNARMRPAMELLEGAAVLIATLLAAGCVIAALLALRIFRDFRKPEPAIGRHNPVLPPAITARRRSDTTASSG